MSGQITVQHQPSKSDDEFYEVKHKVQSTANEKGLFMLADGRRAQLKEFLCCTENGLLVGFVFEPKDLSLHFYQPLQYIKPEEVLSVDGETSHKYPYLLPTTFR